MSTLEEHCDPTTISGDPVLSGFVFNVAKISQEEN